MAGTVHSTRSSSTLAEPRSWTRAITATVATVAFSVGGVVLLAPGAQASQASHDSHVEQTQTYAWDQPVVTVKSTVSRSWGVARAVRQWNAYAVPGQPRLVIRNNATSPDVVIHAVHSHHWWTGLTSGSADSDGTITHITIGLNLDTIVKNKYRFHGSLDAAKDWTTGHELGHALGLEHHQDVKRSVMSYANPWWRTQGVPSRYDFRQLALIYSQ
jgi:predicted Zn-dependent protease